MTAAPEHQLRALVSYLRDMGVNDFYRRDDPQVLLPESLRAALLRAREAPAPAAASGKHSVSPNVNATAAPGKPALTPAPSAGSASPFSSGSPSRPATPFAAAQARGEARVAPVTTPVPSRAEPQPSYFAAEPGHEQVEERTAALPPELVAPMPKPVPFDALAPLPLEIIPPENRAAALQAVMTDIGDCTRCPLAYAGRHKIVFADGNPNATLMFVGEGPGADEDASGLPFVGKAGQLLNNMITAMGIRREDVYIANIVKCRPPGNRTPEFVEATTCSQFLVRQIDIVRPKVIVALGSTAATYLLGVRQSLASLRGRWHTTRGAKVAVTYHPAFLLRDPRQKGEAWKDLQMVMAELGLKAPRKPAG